MITSDNSSHIFQHCALLLFLSNKQQFSSVKQNIQLPVQIVFLKHGNSNFFMFIFIDNTFHFTTKFVFTSIVQCFDIVPTNFIYLCVRLIKYVYLFLNLSTYIIKGRLVYDCDHSNSIKFILPLVIQLFCYMIFKKSISLILTLESTLIYE